MSSFRESEPRVTSHESRGSPRAQAQERVARGRDQGAGAAPVSRDLVAGDAAQQRRAVVDRGQERSSRPPALGADQADRGRFRGHRLVRPERERHARLRRAAERRPDHPVGLGRGAEIDPLLRPRDLEGQQLAGASQRRHLRQRGRRRCGHPVQFARKRLDGLRLPVHDPAQQHLGCLRAIATRPARLRPARHPSRPVPPARNTHSPAPARRTRAMA